MDFPFIKDVEILSYSSNYAITTALPKLLLSLPIMSFDTETRSVYDNDTRGKAKAYLKTIDSSDTLYRKAMLVQSSSGLSFPAITRATHFIFGESRSKAHVIVCDTEEKEIMMWNLVAKYEGLLLVHNALYDLKIMYHKIGMLPKNYVDTSLMVKCLINHVNIWKAKVGLKEIMGDYYIARWALMNDYEPDNLHEPSFIEYSGIDGCATYYLYEILQHEMKGEQS